jgi:hypothetical protein
MRQVIRAWNFRLWSVVLKLGIAFIALLLVVTWIAPDVSVQTEPQRSEREETRAERRDAARDRRAEPTPTPTAAAAAQADSGVSVSGVTPGDVLGWVIYGLSGLLGLWLLWNFGMPLIWFLGAIIGALARTSTSYSVRWAMTAPRRPRASERAGSRSGSPSSASGWPKRQRSSVSAARSPG